jgi:hypothetical protein
MHLGPFEGVGSGPVSSPSASGQRRLPRYCPHQGWRVVKRAPPLLDRDWAVEEKGIKNHLTRVAVRRTDEDSRGNVILPLNSPVWMAGRLRLEEIRSAGSKGPRLRRS